jgi:CubicO group peptidase (beta-lactamase class C family)
MHKRFWLLLLAGSWICAAFGADLPDRLVEGFSAARLQSLTAQVQQDVAFGKLPGATIVIMRNGKQVLAKSIGKQSAGAPMQRDSLFRIYSMTKPIVSAAAMMLVEEGRLQLGNPVSVYLPELKNLQVGVEGSDASGKILETVPAQREMTVLDLLRHTAGFTYGFEGKSLVKDEYNKLGIESVQQSNEEFLDKLSKVPLQAQPGSKWEYSVATDVLGILLERVSGMSLDKLLQEKMFGPLDMRDTGFWVEPARQSRIAEAFEIDPDWKVHVPLLDIRKPPKRFSAGGGLVSTAGDYAKFLQMLLDGGRVGRRRLLAPRTVEAMLTDQLSPLRTLMPGTSITGPRPGFGFGLGFAVRTDAGGAPTLGNVGMADWNGIAGTHFWIDPREKLIVVWMMQAPGARAYYRQLIPNRVYGALLE